MRSTATRLFPLALTALVAAFAALAALAVSGGHTAQAHSHGAHAAGPAITPSELALRNSMRMLWEDHVTWTRLAVISLVGDAPDTEATVARLLRNQRDIGHALAPFYGKPAGAALTRELRKHILIAADLIAAAKAGDEAKVASAQSRWQRNADDVAALFSRLNPRHWQRATLAAMLREHLRLTTTEVVARLRGDWAADVAAYDRVHRHALTMADALSAGLVAQFPRRFR